MKRGLGYVRDVPDTRDKVFKAPPRGALPKTASLLGSMLGIVNQGSLGSCVANSGFQAVRTRQVIQGAASPKLGSRLFGYYMARMIDRSAKYDAGTQIRSFFYAISKVGFPDEDLQPYDDRDDNDPEAPFRQPPPSKAVHQAYDRRSPVVYKRIPQGDAAWDGMKSAIAAGFPVVFGVDVDSDFTSDNFDPKSVLGAPNPNKIEGGHALTAMGYTEKYIVVVNSWGKSWGDGGICYFGPDYIKQADDIWVVEHAPVPGEV